MAQKHYVFNVFMNALRRSSCQGPSYLAERPETEVENLFVSQKNTGFSANALTHKMLKLYREAGFYGASSQSGLRSFATNCIRSGVDIVSLKTLMKHASIQQTSEYVATNEDMLKKAVMGV